MQFAILNFQIIVGIYAADLSKFLSSLFKQDEDPVHVPPPGPGIACKSYFYPDISLNKATVNSKKCNN